MEKKVFDLKPIPRLLHKPVRIDELGWMPDHLFWNRHRKLAVPHVCFTLSRNPGAPVTIIDGIRQEDDLPAPYFSLLRHGTTLHTIRAVRHDELFFTLAPACYDRLLEHHPLPGHFTMNPHIEKILAEILESLNHLFVPGTADRLDDLFIRLLSEASIGVAMKTEGQSDPVIDELVSYLSANFTRPLSVDEVCHRFNLGRRTFYRKWKRKFPDTPPAAFLLAKRLHLAANLLQTTRMGVQEIAQCCGFGNLLYFTQCFNRAFGSPPTIYRRQ